MLKCWRTPEENRRNKSLICKRVHSIPSVQVFKLKAGDENRQMIVIISILDIIHIQMLKVFNFINLHFYILEVFFPCFPT